MIKSKLIAYLKVLDRDELAQLGRFLHSPFFFEGRHPGLAIKLFDYIEPYFPGFDAEELSKESVFEQLYAGQIYDKQKVEVMMARLFKVVKQFIVYQYIDLEDLDQQLVLAKFHREKNMHHYLDLGIKKMKDLQGKVERRGTDYFRNEFLVAREVMFRESAHKLRGSDLNLPVIHEHFDTYYLLNKLELACQLLAQNKHHLPIEMGDTLKTLDLLKPLFEAGRFDHAPLVKLFYTAYQWLRGEQEPPDSLIESLRSYGPQVPIDQLKVIHTLYRNYCVRKYNEGNQAFLHSLFEMYCLSLEEGLLLTNGKVLQSTLQTVVNTGLKLKKYDWVYQFLETHKDKIADTNYPTEIYSSNLARYYFELKAYDKALDCLAHDYEDTYYKIAAKLMEIKIYYEQNGDLLDYKMQAFKVYLHRISNSLLPEVQKLGYNNFIDLLKQICHYSTLKNEKRIEKLLTKLHSTKVLAERDWLKEKLEKQRG